MDWQPIETIPDAVERAILWGISDGEIHGKSEEPSIVVAHRPYGSWTIAEADCYSVYIYPTHWMPLPPPPASDPTP